MNELWRGRPPRTARPFALAKLQHLLSPGRGLESVRAGFVERGREAVAVPPLRVGGGGTSFRRLRFLSVRPVRRLCRSCGDGGLTGEDAGSGFEFGSRFDDMSGGARGFGVN